MRGCENLEGKTRFKLDQVHLACRTQDVIGWNWTDFIHLAKERNRVPRKEEE